MATFTARQIITASLLDLGIIAEESSIGGVMGADALYRLNSMVSGWQAQSQTVVAVERTIFPLVANQQTYTIGLGGDFDVPRPISISGAGLLLNGLASPQAITSIVRTDFTATVTQTSHPFAVGDEAFIQGAAEIAYNGLQTVQTVPDANTYTFTVQGEPVSPATGTLTAAAIEGEPVEIPRTVLTDDAYQAIQLKNMGNSQFTNVYYNPTFPYGTIFLWPRIDTAVNQLVLYLQNVFSGFATLDTEYQWPNLPGYAEALQYQFDKRLAITYRRPLDPKIEDLARETFGIVKRANNRLTDLPNDAALLTHDPRSAYNINTGTGG